MKDDPSDADFAELEPLIEQTGAELSSLATRLSGESEQASVILCGAWVDEALMRLLRGVLKPCAGGRDSLLEADRPLGTFSSRILLAHRMGLIGDDFESALNLLRRLRNDFAHSTDLGSLSGSKHRNWVRELVHRANTSGFWEQVTKWTDSATPKGQLIAASLVMLVELETLTLLAKTISVSHRANFEMGRTGSR